MLTELTKNGTNPTGFLFGADGLLSVAHEFGLLLFNNIFVFETIKVGFSWKVYVNTCID